MCAASMDFASPCLTASSDPSVNTGWVRLFLHHSTHSSWPTLLQTYNQLDIQRSSIRHDIHWSSATEKEQTDALQACGRSQVLLERIEKDIKWQLSLWLSNVDRKRDTKNLWASMCQLTGRLHEIANSDGITAESLDNHYVNISTDPSYIQNSEQSVTNSHGPGWTSSLIIKSQSHSILPSCGSGVCVVSQNRPTPFPG